MHQHVYFYNEVCNYGCASLLSLSYKNRTSSGTDFREVNVFLKRGKNVVCILTVWKGDCNNAKKPKSKKLALYSSSYKCIWAKVSSQNLKTEICLQVLKTKYVPGSMAHSFHGFPQPLSSKRCRPVFIHLLDLAPPLESSLGHFKSSRTHPD